MKPMDQDLSRAALELYAALTRAGKSKKSEDPGGSTIEVSSKPVKARRKVVR